MERQVFSLESMEKCLNLVLSDTPESIINSKNVAELMDMGKKLPPGFSNFQFGFECRLGQEDTPVDLFVGLSKKKHGYSKIEEIIQHPIFLEHSQNNRSWERLVQLINEYKKNHRLLSRWLDNIILEFDEQTFSQAHPVPSIFMGIRPHSPLYPERRATSSEIYRVILHGLEGVMDKKMPMSLKSSLKEFIRYLPKQANIFQVGAMISRKYSTIRVCIRDIRIKKILSFVQDSYWSSDISSLQYVTDVLGGVFDSSVLSLDIGDGVHPRIGIECYFQKKQQPSRELRWEEILSLLVKERLCTQEKARGLLSFPARQEYYPNFTDQKSRSNKERKEYPLLMLRGLHHLKFTTDLEDDVSAKAYLFARVLPMM